MHLAQPVARYQLAELSECFTNIFIMFQANQTGKNQTGLPETRHHPTETATTNMTSHVGVYLARLIAGPLQKTVKNSDKDHKKMIVTGGGGALKGVNTVLQHKTHQHDYINTTTSTQNTSIRLHQNNTMHITFRHLSQNRTCIVMSVRMHNMPLSHSTCIAVSELMRTCLCVHTWVSIHGTLLHINNSTCNTCTQNINKRVN